jgi:hypothetical protein
MTGLGTKQVAAIQNQRPEDASSSAKPIRVMVADDSVMARVVARRALKSARMFKLSLLWQTGNPRSIAFRLHGRMC